MKKHYDVMFTNPNGNRGIEEFNNKGKARKFAKQKVKEGCTNVFLDTYDNGDLDNLINYECIT